MRAKLALFDNKQASHAGADHRKSETRNVAATSDRRRSLTEIRSPLTPMTPNAGRLSFTTPEAKRNLHNSSSDSKKIAASPSSGGSKNLPKKVPWNSKWKVSKSPQPKHLVNFSADNREGGDNHEMPTPEPSGGRLYKLSRRHSARLIAARSSRQTQGIDSSGSDPSAGTSSNDSEQMAKSKGRKVVATPPKNLLQKRDKAIRKIYGAEFAEKRYSGSSENSDKKDTKEGGTPAKRRRRSFKALENNHSLALNRSTGIPREDTAVATKTCENWKGKKTKFNTFLADDNAKNIFRSSFLGACQSNREQTDFDDRKNLYEINATKEKKVPENEKILTPPKRKSSFVHRIQQPGNGTDASVFQDDANQGNPPIGTMYSRLLGKAKGGPVSVVEIRRAASQESRITDITEFTSANEDPTRSPVVSPKRKFYRHERNDNDNNLAAGRHFQMKNKSRPWEGLVPPPPPPPPQPHTFTAMPRSNTDESAPSLANNPPVLSVRDRIVAHNRQRFDKGALLRPKQQKDKPAWATQNLDKDERDTYRSFHPINVKTDYFGTFSSTESTSPDGVVEGEKVTYEIQATNGHAKMNSNSHLSVRERVAFHNQNPIEPTGVTPKSSFERQSSKAKQYAPKEPIGAASDADGKIEPSEGKPIDPESSGFQNPLLTPERVSMRNCTVLREKPHFDPSGFTSKDERTIQMPPTDEICQSPGHHRNPVDPESSELILANSVINDNSVQQRIARLTQDSNEALSNSKRSKSLSPKRSPVFVNNARNRDEVEKLQSEISDLRLRIKILDKDGNRTDLIELIEEKEQECREKGEKLKKLNEKLDKIEKGLAEIEAERLSLTNKVHELETEKDRTEKQLRLREGEITSLSKRCLDQAEELKEVTAFRVEKNTMTREIESMKESMAKKSLEDVTTIDCLKQKVNETKRARDELSIQLSKIKRERDDYSRRLEDCLKTNEALSKEKSRWEAEKSSLLKEVECQIKQLKIDHDKELFERQKEIRGHEIETKRLRDTCEENANTISALSKKLEEAKVTAEETLKTLENRFESKLESQNKYIDALKQELTETAASLQIAQEMLHESEKTVAERDIIVEDLLEQLSQQERQAAEALQSVKDEFESQAIEALHMAKSNFCKLLQEFVSHSELEVNQLRREYEAQISSVQSRLEKITNDSEGRAEESQSMIDRLNTQLLDAEGKITSLFERHEEEMKASRKEYEDAKVSLQYELDLVTAKYTQEITEKNTEISRLIQTNADERNTLEAQIRQLTAEAQRTDETVSASTLSLKDELQSLQSDHGRSRREFEIEIAKFQEKLEIANAKHAEEINRKNSDIERLRNDNDVQREKLKAELKVQESATESLNTELSRTRDENDRVIEHLTGQVSSMEQQMKLVIEKHEREMAAREEKIAYLESSGHDEKQSLILQLRNKEESKNELITKLENELHDLKTSSRTQIESRDAQLMKLISDHKAQIEKLEKEKADQLSDFMESLRSKDEDLGFRCKEKLEIQAEKSVVEAELRKSTAILEEKEALIKKLDSELSACQQQLEKKVASFSETISSLNAEHEKDMERLSASQKTEVSMLEAKLVERNSMIECLEKDMEAQMRQLMVTTSKLEELQGDSQLVEGLTADIEALELERAAMAEDLHDKDMNIAELSAEILKLEIEKELVEQDSIELKKVSAKLSLQDKQHASQLKEILERHMYEQKKYSAEVTSLQEDLQQKRDHLVSLQESLRRAEASLEKSSENAKLSDQVLKEKDRIIGELRSEVSKQMIENRGLASKLAVKEDELRDLEVVEMYDKNEKIRLLQNNVDNLSAQLEFKTEQFNLKVTELETEASDLKRKLLQTCKQATDQRDSMQREIDAFHKQCESSKREVDYMKIKLEETERKLKDAKLDSASFSTKINDLEVACKELQDNCRQLQLAREEVSNERDELTMRLEKEMALVQEHEDIRWDLERRCEELKQELDSREDSSSEQSKQIEDLKNTIEEKKLLNEELSRHNKELESFLQTQNLAVDQVQAEVNSLRVKLQAREDQIKELKADKANQEQNLLEELETERQNLQIATSELEAAQQKLGVLLRENKDIAELEKEREALQDKVRRQEAYLKRKLEKEKMGRVAARPNGLQPSPVKRTNANKRHSTPSSVSPELQNVPTQSTATMSTGGSKLDWELDCLLAD